MVRTVYILLSHSERTNLAIDDVKNTVRMACPIRAGIRFGLEPGSAIADEDCIVSLPNRLKIPPRMAPSSTVVAAISLSGLTKNFINNSNVAVGAALEIPSDIQFIPRTAAVIDPPETLDIRFRVPNVPISLRRQRLPTWNSIARYPPPERQRPVPACGTLEVWSCIGESWSKRCLPLKLRNDAAPNNGVSSTSVPESYNCDMNRKS
jgi:hypothetical protein